LLCTDSVFWVCVMLSKIKAYALVVLGAIAAFGMFMWQFTRANYAKAKLKGSERARKTENKATEGMIDDLNKENKVTGSVDDGKFLD
jgi:hypothetical protein